MDSWTQRDHAAREFWQEYVRTARAGFDLEFDHSDEMRVAITELFGKIDQATSDANASGCLFFKCTSPRKQPQKVTLLFSDGKGKTLRHTLKIDTRFHRGGSPLNSHDFSELKIAVQSLIIDEGKVRPDPKGGWISPV
jgi:hypothetical protein